MFSTFPQASLWRSLAFLIVAVICLAKSTPGVAQNLVDLLNKADPSAGERVFAPCRACHTVKKGGANGAGPNLYGIVGRAVATADGYPYSRAMRAYGDVWTPDHLNAFLESPRTEVPGTRMAFPGLPKAEDRADLIAFLNSLSSSPLDFGGDDMSGKEGGGATDAVNEADNEPEIGRLVSGPGAEETYIYCTACHSEMIVIQQGKTREHWADLFEWMMEEQGMAEIPEPDRSRVLDYLAENYNEDRPNFPRR